MGIIGTVVLVFVVIAIYVWVSQGKRGAQKMKFIAEVEQRFVEDHGRKMNEAEWDDFWRRHPDLANKALDD